MSANKQCRYCNFKNEGDAVFCGKRGKRIAAAPVQQADMNTIDRILEKDERVFLELEKGQKAYHPTSKLHAPMFLTNRRLVLFQDEKIGYEVPLSKIEEVHRESGNGGWSSLKLKLLDGSEDEIRLWVEGRRPMLISWFISPFGPLRDRLETGAVIDRWVSVINGFILDRSDE